MRFTDSINLRRLSKQLACCAVLLLSGCGFGGTLVPVKGRVLVQGAPAVGAFVQFHPEGEIVAEGKLPSPRPSARVKADGSFELSTLLPGQSKPGLGAPPGRYGVTVMLRTQSKIGDCDEVDLLPIRYLHPTTSGLVAVVNEEATEVPPFELSNR